MVSLLVIYVALALGVSFMCSVMEAVLLSITPGFQAALSEKGDPVAPKLKALRKDIEMPLGAILTLNTIAHTVGAAGAGAEAEKVFGGGTATVIFAGVLTLLILVGSEIIPKTLGANNWKKLTPSVVGVLSSWPMRILGKISQGITRLFFKEKPASRVSRDEIGALAELGRQQGVFAESESAILRSLLRFGQINVEAVMTPRTVVFALPSETNVQEAGERIGESPFARIPVYEDGNRDHVAGYVLRRDVLLEAARDNHDEPISKFQRELPVLRETDSLQKAFEMFLRRREQMALVIDEYGGMAGVVTQEDVVETLLGLEIVDEVDAQTDMQKVARQQWKKRAKELGIELPVRETDEEAAKQRDAVARTGLTGGQAPQE
ncbi:MAG: hemolysin family protein [Bacteroidota bacterium]